MAFKPFGIRMPKTISISSLNSTVLVDTGKTNAIIISSLALFSILVIAALLLMHKFNKLKPIYEQLRRKYAKTQKLVNQVEGRQI